MDLAGYVTLTRQSGLLKEMQAVANNIANVSTTGFRREGVLFAEHVRALPAEGGSIAMTEARGRWTDGAQGVLVRTGGVLDLAIEGEGFFRVLTPAGERLTRAGAFSRNGEGDVVTPDGHLLLDEGGGPINLPFEAQAIAVAADGTLSVDGEPAALIGVVMAEDATKLFRETGVLFRYEGDPMPAEGATVVQGFLEQSNVDAVTEMARMIAVQRAYEYGQKLVEQEDERIRLVVRTLAVRA